MAVTLPVLGLTSAVKPLHGSCSSHRHALATTCVPDSVVVPSLCRVRSSDRALCRDGVASSGIRELSELGFANVLGGEVAEHLSESGRSTEDPLPLLLPLPPVLENACKASALAIAAAVVSAGASLADEEVAASATAASDVGISGPISVLFVAASIGLVVLTGGVAYLSVTEFLEKRALQEEQKKVEEAKPKKPTKQVVKAAARAGGPKGFGSGKRTKGGDEESSN